MELPRWGVRVARANVHTGKRLGDIQLQGGSDVREPA